MSTALLTAPCCWPLDAAGECNRQHPLRRARTRPPLTPLTRRARPQPSVGTRYTPRVRGARRRGHAGAARARGATSRHPSTCSQLPGASARLAEAAGLALRLQQSQDVACGAPPQARGGATFVLEIRATRKVSVASLQRTSAGQRPGAMPHQDAHTRQRARQGARPPRHAPSRTQKPTLADGALDVAHDEAVLVVQELHAHLRDLRGRGKAARRRRRC